LCSPILPVRLPRGREGFSGGWAWPVAFGPVTLPAVESHIEAIEILGVPVARMTASQALDEIKLLGERAGPSLVAYASAHTLNIAHGDGSFRDLLRRADLILNDGSGVAIAARLQRKPFPDNLNGTDFNPRVLELAAAAGWPVFFLGARPGVSDRAAAALGALIPSLEVAGTHSGYFDSNDDVVERIRSSGPTLLMVGMGNPLQETWLAEHLERTGVSVGIGVGAFFDFFSGEVPRAPSWMKRGGIEWVYRLAQEPGRMWRRYLLGNPLFLGRVVRERILARDRTKPAQPPSLP
jgi:exopolysaccharide biosynthesis WecB/TagA/CpsF family protein